MDACPQCGADQVLDQGDCQNLWHFSGGQAASTPRTLDATTEQIKSWPPLEQPVGSVHEMKDPYKLAREKSGWTEVDESYKAAMDAARAQFPWNKRLERRDQIARSLEEVARLEQGLEQRMREAAGQYDRGTWNRLLEQASTMPPQPTSEPVSDELLFRDTKCLNCGIELPEDRWDVAKWCNGSCYNAWQLMQRTAVAAREARVDMLDTLWAIAGAPFDVRLYVSPRGERTIVVADNRYRWDSDADMLALDHWHDDQHQGATLTRLPTPEGWVRHVSDP